MPVAVLAVGAFVLVKAGAVMGQYSLKNYDPNPGSAYDRKPSLPGTDGQPLDIKKKKAAEKEKAEKEKAEKEKAESEQEKLPEK